MSFSFSPSGTQGFLSLIFHHSSLVYFRSHIQKALMTERTRGWCGVWVTTTTTTNMAQITTPRSYPFVKMTLFSQSSRSSLLHTWRREPKQHTSDVGKAIFAGDMAKNPSGDFPFCASRFSLLQGPDCLRKSSSLSCFFIDRTWRANLFSPRMFTETPSDIFIYTIFAGENNFPHEQSAMRDVAIIKRKDRDADVVIFSARVVISFLCDGGNYFCV